MRQWLVILLLLPCLAQAQAPNLDSLWGVWNDESQPDTSRLIAINNFIWKGYLFTQPDSARYFAQLEYDFAKARGVKGYMAEGLNTQGTTFYLQADYANALDLYTKSLTIYKEIGQNRGIASALNNIGLIYINQGNYARAIESLTEALRVIEKMGDKKGIASSLSNIGMIYYNLGDYPKALKYYTKGLKIQEKMGYKEGLSQSLNGMGGIHFKQGNYDKAINYFTKSIKILEEIGNKQQIGAVLNNIGVIYLEQGDSASSESNSELSTDKYRKSIDYFMKSLKVYQEIGELSGVSGTLTNIGKIYKAQGNYSKALEYCSRSLKLAQEIGAAFQTETAAKVLWEINKFLGHYKAALENYELYIATRDTIMSEQNQKEVIRQGYKYEYEKQAAADSVKAAEAAKVKDAQLTAQRAENARQQQQAYYLYGGLALALLFGGFIFNRFRVTNKQKKVIEVQKVEVEKQREFADSQRQLAEEQKEVVEEKNKEIIDSINYAKRLQEAILPPQKLVKEYLQQSFILYKPKDIVAGDFYWMETVGDTVYFAAADCTGHGVPGAMVSVVCSNALSKALIEENITDVGKLLDRTRELVVERFGRSEKNIQDGMDLALCALKTKTNEMHYAGANNPLWVIRKGAEEVEETKANKQPIGKYDKEDPFTAHTLQLNQGDSLYIFSDGYPDQFGGEKGKKYKTGAMKKFLLSIQDKDLPTQRQLLNEEFECWKGELEQIDDVCVIGVRV